MTMIFRAGGFAILMALGPSVSFAQTGPVSWHFEAQRLNGNAANLLLTATLAPGWHLYSQHMEAGGPIPTHIRFETGDDVTLEGITLEKGDPHTIHDSLYEMDVTWHTGSVVFEQRIRLINPVTALRGAVEYMTCNDEICIPERKTFSIPMQP